MHLVGWKRRGLDTDLIHCNLSGKEKDDLMKECDHALVNSKAFITFSVSSRILGVGGRKCK